MRTGDILVEWRDKTLARKGAIPISDLNLRCQPVLNGIGTWSLQLPAGHRAVPALRAAGSGVIITNLATGAILMSGSSSKPAKTSTKSDPEGLVSISGLSDDRLLWDALAFPQPSNSNPGTQNVTNDVRTGVASTIMRQFAAFNIANGAIAAGGAVSWAPSGRLKGLRNYFRMDSTGDPLIGAVLTKSPRFDNLGDLLVEIANTAGIRFRVVQVDQYLELQIEAIEDKTAVIRLDVKNGTLDSQSVEFAPPDVTRVIVAGQGEGTARQILTRTNATAASAEDDWGLVIESFKDQRNTNVTVELEASGDELLATGGFTKTAVKAVPSNDVTMRYPEDWNLGDRVTVIVDGQETHSNVTEAAIIADRSGVVTGAAIGNVSDFDSTSALKATVTDTQTRVDKLEKNTSASGPTLPSTALRLRLTSTADASLVSTDHGLQIGSDGSENLIVDNNEIIARNNGAVANLHLNTEGGGVIINNSVSASRIKLDNGRIDANHVPWSTAAGQISGVITAGTPEVDTITFPTGAFTVAPNVVVGRTGNASQDISVVTSSISATGFTVTRIAGGTGTRTVGAVWQAVQMTPTTAGG